MTDPAALPTFGLPVGAEPASPETHVPDGAAGAGFAGAGPAGAGAGGAGAGGAGAESGTAGVGAAPGTLRDQVVAALTGAGYPARIDPDGDVAITVQEQMLFVRCTDSVPPLMRVFGQWLIDDLPRDELVRLRAANAVTASVNLAKATVHEDRLVVAVDLVVGHGIHLPSLLHASMDAVLGCVRTWHATVLRLTS